MKECNNCSNEKNCMYKQTYDNICKSLTWFFGTFSEEERSIIKISYPECVYKEKRRDKDGESI